jgi:curli biogenesis system outer membrane secretion channel CsgG
MKTRIAVSLLAIAGIGLSACVTGGGRDRPGPERGAHPGVHCKGPKKRVAVLRFGGTGQYGAHEGWDVGDALASQLSTGLQGTGCFLIADRSVLSELLREQEFGLAGITSRETAPRAGRMIGAQILIKGDVTEFEPEKRGGGLTIGIGIPHTPFALRLGGNRATAHLALNLRMIDASTGQLLQTRRVEADAGSTGMIVGFDYRYGSIGTDGFARTPFGSAARKALNRAVTHILDTMQEVSWQGQVVQSVGGRVFLNAGSEAGIAVGDTFAVSAIAEELVDPATGLVLGRVEQPLGRVQIQAVDARYSVALPLGTFQVKRGDVLRR